MLVTLTRHTAMVALLLLLAPLTAEAQQAPDIPRIGYLSVGSALGPRDEAFLQGLRELRYAQGRNVVIEYRYAQDRLERLPELAAELVRLKVDVIVALSTLLARPAKKATQTIPIVTVSGDPVGTGLVSSLARPGGNVTGLTFFSPELAPKRLELLRETIPGVSRVAVLWNPRRRPVSARSTGRPDRSGAWAGEAEGLPRRAWPWRARVDA